MQKFEITRNYTLEVPDSIEVFGFGRTGLKFCNAEDNDLISAVAHFKHKHKDLANIVLHIPNESDMPVQARVKAKKKGLLSGAADLLIMTCPAIAIEFKMLDYKKAISGKKAQEHIEKQIRILHEMSMQGNKAALVFGFEGYLECYEKMILPQLRKSGRTCFY